MSDNENDEKLVNFRKKDEAVRDRWDSTSAYMSVSSTFFNFDSPERIQKYIDAQFITEAEKQKYAWYREEWYRRPKEFDPGPQPLSVICELVSTCNLGCNMCYTITPAFQNSVIGAQRILPWPLVTKIIDECAELGVPSILFSWRGESTLYRSKHEGKVYTFPDALKYARDKGILEVTSLTHGQLIDDKMARALIDADPSWISFSVDGLFEDYNKIRTPRNKKNDEQHDAFSVVVESIKRLKRYRDEAGKTRPQLRCNTIFPAISKDPEAYYEFMSGIGIDLVSVNELLEWSHYEDNGDLPIEAIDLDWGCQYPYQRLTVSANGVIVPCNGAVHEEVGLVLGRYQGSAPKTTRNLDGTIALAELAETSLADVWRSPKLDYIREMHKTKKRIEINPGCRNCNHGIVKRGVTWVPKDWDVGNMNWREKI